MKHPRNEPLGNVDPMGNDTEWSGPELSTVGALLADPARVAILMALVGGEPMRPGSLARIAGVAPSTATFHLAKLVDAGWVTITETADHRRYQLASTDVAALVEHLAYLAPPRPVNSLKAHRRRDELRMARSCYDHIAGLLGVTIVHAFLRHDIVRGDTDHFELTASGVTRLHDHGIDVSMLTQTGRDLARPCLDWTERDAHLGGALGSAVLSRWLETGIVSRGKTARSLQVSETGADELRQWGVSWPPTDRTTRVADADATAG